MSSVVLKNRPGSAPERRRHAGNHRSTVRPKSRALPPHDLPSPHVAECAADAPAHPPWYRSNGYELVNAITHGLGLALAAAGALVMTATVLNTGDAWRIAGCGVFVVTMLAVYAASTLSHSGFAVRWRAFLRRLDQGAIYLLVVGTFTPFVLTYLRTGAGWFLLAALWTGAIAGFLSKVFFAHRLDSGLIWTYVTLGLLPTLTIPWLWAHVPPGTGSWMVLGGACYLVGTIFLVNDARVRPFHAIWHLLVIAGTTCHFLGILALATATG